MEIEEDFFDDDLDDDLQVLEQNVLAATQASVRQDSREGRDLRGSTSRGLPTWKPLQRLNQEILKGPPTSAPDLPSSDYGLGEGDVIDLDESPSLIRSNRHARPNTGPETSVVLDRRRHGITTLDPETEAAFAAADAELANDASIKREQIHPSTRGAGDDHRLRELQARIAELESDRDRLRRIEEDARSTAIQKNGEIAVVRSNHAKVVKEYENRINALQKQHLEDVTKHKAELELGRREREKMETDNRFLQHDLAQETEKAKRVNGTVKTRAIPVEISTPKKIRRVNIGDGFDVDEVIMSSPSKSRDGTREKTKSITPRQANKRKRSAADSPVGSLSLATSPARRRSDNQVDSQPPANARSLSSPTTRGSSQSQDRYEVMQLLLRYQGQSGKSTAIEDLGKYHFPSQPFSGRSLSSLLFEKLATPSSPSTGQPLHFPLSEALAMLWTISLDQGYHTPLNTILDLLRLSIYHRAPSETSRLIETLTPLCLRSIQLVYYTHVKASIHTKFATQVNHEKQRQLVADVNTDEVLAILKDVCEAASLDQSTVEQFWKSLPMEDALLMLNKALPLYQILDTVEILRTSVLPNTFGPICDDPNKQNMQEIALLDRLSGLLFEMPVSIEGEDPYTDIEIAHLRIGVLNLFKTMCEVEHAGVLLAQHRTIVGRLLKFLNGQLNQLYTTTPALHDPSSPEETHRRLIVQTINTATRILYHLLRAYDSLINISDKLSMVRGGYHIFLVSMTRLAFSEQLVYEHGIEDEVAEAAHLILDNILSPEEGDAIREAVETPRGSKDARPSEVLALARGVRERDSQADADADTAMSDAL